MLTMVVKRSPFCALARRRGRCHRCGKSMKITEHLARAGEPLISFEIIPPTRGGDIHALMAVVEDLAQWHPPFIDITSHPAETVFKETPDGIKKRVVRKRPGTLGICALIQNKYAIDAVPHVLCHGFTQQETEDFLIELRYLGIDNVLAIQGDDKGLRKQDGRSVNTYAIDLIRQIGDMNHGRYLDEEVDLSPTDFCVGAACYPEKHMEAPNLETDIRHVREKVDAGAEYLVTQMFFDNAHYFSYVEQCRSAGIDVPIFPGLKVITTKAQLRTIPRTFACEIPHALSEEIDAASPKHVREVGVRWTVAQARELLERGVPALHFYVMLNSRAIRAVMAELSR